MTEPTSVCPKCKNSIDRWLPKLRGDQRAAKAEIAAIVKQALPTQRK